MDNVGTINFKVADVSNLGSAWRCSETQTIGDFPWSLGVFQDRLVANHYRLMVRVFCNPENTVDGSTLWFCKARLEVTLKNSLRGEPSPQQRVRINIGQQRGENSNRGADGGDDLQLQLIHDDQQQMAGDGNGGNGQASSDRVEVVHVYDQKSLSFAEFSHQFPEWHEIMDPARGYVTDDSIELEARVEILETSKIRPHINIDFTASSVLTDACLVVQGTKIYVNKAHLAMYSQHFYTLFFGNFAERGMEEIPLADVDPNEFIEMLKVIHPPHSAVTVHNVDYLLKVSGQFLVDYVVRECEKFLITSQYFKTWEEKMVLADRYRLHSLLNELLKELKSVGDVQRVLREMGSYEELTELARAALADRMRDLLRHRTPQVAR